MRAAEDQHHLHVYFRACGAGEVRIEYHAEAFEHSVSLSDVNGGLVLTLQSLVQENTPLTVQDRYFDISGVTTEFYDDRLNVNFTLRRLIGLRLTANDPPPAQAAISATSLEPSVFVSPEPPSSPALVSDLRLSNESIERNYDIRSRTYRYSYQANIRLDFQIDVESIELGRPLSAVAEPQISERIAALPPRIRRLLDERLTVPSQGVSLEDLRNTEPVLRLLADRVGMLRREPPLSPPAPAIPAPIMPVGTAFARPVGEFTRDVEEIQDQAPANKTAAERPQRRFETD